MRSFKKYIIFASLFSVCGIAVLLTLIGNGHDLTFKNWGTKHSDNILSLNVYNDLREEYRQFNLSITEVDNIVFIGDSISKRYNFQEFFPDIRILNRGVFSDTTEGLLNRIEDNVNNIHVSKLFIMIGYNDLAVRKDQEILKNIKSILLKAKADKVFIHSLLPVKASRKNENIRIDRINQSLKNLSEKLGATYIDIHLQFVDSNGGMLEKYSRDGIHPNYYGYAVWSQILKKYLF